jgi:hypothetical protein
MPLAVAVSFEVALAVIGVLVVLPILWWIILGLTGGFRRKR